MAFSIGIISNDAYLGVGIALLLLSAGSVAIRCLLSVRQHKKMLVDDHLSIAGLVISAGLYVFNEFQYKTFFRQMPLSYFIKTGVAVPILASFSLWTAKAPVLVLYVRLFGVRRWLKWACHVTLAVSAVGFIACLGPPLRQCRPADTPHVLYKWRRCGKAVVDASVVQGTLSVASDLVILLLPLRPIYSLRLSRGKKLGLGLVFFSGIFGLVASILSLAYKVHLFLGARGDNGSILTSMLLQWAECAIAIMAGCVPAVKGFFKGYIATSKIYSTLSSLSSKLFTGSARTTGSGSSGGRGSAQGPGQEGEHCERDKLGPVTYLVSYGASGEYIRMDSPHGSEAHGGRIEV